MIRRLPGWTDADYNFAGELLRTGETMHDWKQAVELVDATVKARAAVAACHARDIGTYGLDEADRYCAVCVEVLPSTVASTSGLCHDCDRETRW